MTYRHFKHEGWLYLLAVLLAVALRFIQLGAMPLTDAEAAPALQALRVAQGLKPALDPHPLYILSTSVLFFLYGGGTNFLARFIPALVGSLLVLAPLLFAEERIKPRASVILAFFIALDPGLVALSRQAASPILAVAFLIFAGGFFNKSKINLAGVCAALALLGGESIWAGVISLGIAYAIHQALESRRATELPIINYQSPITNPQLLIPFFATFIIVGSLFFIAPNGLSAALASIPAFISRWTSASNMSASRMLFSLVIYQPLGVLLGVIAIARGWINGSRKIIPLSIWFFVALLIAIFIPSRQMSDLAWALIPFWVMAAFELTRNVDIFADERLEVIGVVFLTTFIWTFAWIDLAGMAANDASQFNMRLWLLIGSIFLLVFSLLLVAAGWSIRSAQIGGVWGLTIAFSVLSLGGALGAAGLRGTSFPELWTPNNLPAQANLLQATVNDISRWGAGEDNSAPVIISGVNSPALEWALREHQVSVVETLDISSAPYFVITPLQDNPALASAYRGQDFTWRQNPSWDATQSKDWIRWVALREMPQSGETIILWARDDMFVDK